MTLDEQIRLLKFRIILSSLGLVCVLIVLALWVWMMLDRSLLEAPWWYLTSMSLVVLGIALAWPRDIK